MCNQHRHCVTASTHHAANDYPYALITRKATKRLRAARAAGLLGGALELQGQVLNGGLYDIAGRSPEVVRGGSEAAHENAKAFHDKCEKTAIRN
jgi:hypothetical protein